MIKKNHDGTVIQGSSTVLQNRTILQGQVLEKLKDIPDESIDVVISSPPYWGLRDYQVEGQWGLEPDFRDYLKKMRDMMNELKRVLKKTGTCWMNMGDTYSDSGKGFGGDPEASKEVSFQNDKPLLNYTIQDKSRFGMPERFYTQCIDDGWIARNHIPWYKENGMPSSVKDRFTNKWESIFFFAKEQHYYFNLNAIREKPKTKSKPFNLRIREAKKGKGQLALGDDPRAWKASQNELENYNDKGERIKDKYRDYNTNSNADELHLNDRKKKQNQTLGADGKPKLNYKGFNYRWGYNPIGKNPGDVFFINTHPFPEAHFATFPVELPLKILKCACPPQVCTKCGEPREPILKPTPEYQKYLDSIKRLEPGNLETGYQNYKNETQSTTEYEAVVDWSKCDCSSEFQPGIILDPFFGAGTVGVAAEQLGLHWCGIELKQEYINIARKRLQPYMMERLI